MDFLATRDDIEQEWVSDRLSVFNAFFSIKAALRCRARIVSAIVPLPSIEGSGVRLLRSLHEDYAEVIVGYFACVA